MKYLLVLLISLMSYTGIQSQNLNAYEHVIVPMRFDFQNEPNEHQLNILSRVLLKDAGFKVFMDTEDRPLKYRGNSCLPLFFDVIDESGFLNIKVRFILKDCYDRILFESEIGATKIKDFKEGFQAALREAFISLREENYSYNSSLSKEAGSESTAVSTVTKATSPEDLYPDKKIYKFGGESFWLIEEAKNYKILSNNGRINYGQLEAADRGSFIFKSATINGAAYFDADGNLIVEYRDEDLDEVQTMIFKKTNQ